MANAESPLSCADVFVTRACLKNSKRGKTGAEYGVNIFTEIFTYWKSSHTMVYYLRFIFNTIISHTRAISFSVF